MSACLAQQEPLKVAYLGPEGTFTQQAVHRHFGHSVHATGLPAIDSVFEQVQGGDADFGVVPVENSSQGIVSHTLDMFLLSDLKICGEIELRVHQNLLTMAKSLAQIERVYSVITSYSIHYTKLYERLRPAPGRTGSSTPPGAPAAIGRAGPFPASARGRTVV